VHGPPPVELVHYQVGGVVEGEQEEDGQAPQTQQQHHGDGGLAALQHGHGDVEEEGQGHDDDADLGHQGLFQEFPAHGFKNVITRQFSQGGVRNRQVADNGQGACHQEDPEQG